MSCYTPYFPCGGSSACNITYRNRADRRPLEFLNTSYEALSGEDKARLNRDLYGYERPILESPTLIHNKLEELERELGRLSDAIKDAFNKAMHAELDHPNESINESNEKDENNRDNEYNYEFASSRKLRLMFLRAERFNARMAARRLARYFKEKLELFGIDKLICTIKQRDLSQEDLKAIRSGAVVIPEVTDAYGRLIVLNKRSCFRELKLSSMKRMIFYLYMKALRDNEDYQRKGVVIIANNIGFRLSSADTKRRKEIFALLRTGYRALPVLVASIHHCYDDLKEHIFINIICVVMPNDVRARLQCHYGDHEDMLLDLMKYGIDVGVLPLTLEGETRRNFILDYLEKTRLQEESEDTIKSNQSQTIPCPSLEQETFALNSFT